MATIEGECPQQNEVEAQCEGKSEGDKNDQRQNQSDEIKPFFSDHENKDSYLLKLTKAQQNYQRMLASSFNQNKSQKIFDQRFSIQIEYKTNNEYEGKKGDDFDDKQFPQIQIKNKLFIIPISSLFVDDLAKHVTEFPLFELFNAVGPVACIRVRRHAQTRESLGCANVFYYSQKDAERALDTLNFVSIRGKQCRIMWADYEKYSKDDNKSKIFVKNLYCSIDSKTLYDTFSVFGSVIDCKIYANQDGSSKCCGYVHYADQVSAKSAIKGVNGLIVLEKAIIAEPFRKKT